MIGGSIALDAIDVAKASNNERMAAPACRRKLERRREPGFEKLSRFRRRLKLRNGIQFLKCRRERVRQAPDRSRPELFILRLEVEIVNRVGEMLWRFQFALADYDFRRDISDFAPLPGLYLLAHRLEVALNAISTDRNAVDQ